MDNDLRILVERLERIFPHLKLYYEGETFDSIVGNDRSGYESEYSPPREYDWYELIQILEENGLEIKNIK